MLVAVLGLGEAGRRYARDLASIGALVTAYDVRPVEPPAGVSVAASVAAAVEGADLVLSLTTAAGALDAAKSAAGQLAASAVYADLNAASPAEKAAVASCFAVGQFADVAVLAPVARAGLRTPVLVAGPGAAAFAELLRPYHSAIEVVAGPPGSAAARKLLRSIFMKSLATSVLEALTAGRAAGCEDWVRAQIVGELGAGGEALVERLVTGTYQHAQRRLHEMEATAAYLRELGVPSEMTVASAGWLAELSAGRRNPDS